MRHLKAHAYILLLVGQVIYSFSGVFARQSSLPPVTLCFYRMLFSLPLLLVPAKKALKVLDLHDFFLLLAGGFFMAIDFSLWTTALSHTTLVNANLLANLNILLIVPLSKLLFHEKTPKFFIYGGILAIVGAVILINCGNTSDGVRTLWGDFLALCSSVSYSIYFLFAYKARTRMDTTVVLFGNTLGSIPPLFFFMLFLDGVSFPRSSSALYSVFGIIVCSQIIGLGTLNYCMKRISANMLSLFLLTAPAASAITGWLFFSEQLTFGKVVGIFLLGSGILLAQK